MAQHSASSTSLPTEINIATRSLHTELNRLITSRLPLALPPVAVDPCLYTTGLLHFAHVYLTFESLWADLLPPAAPGTANSPPTSPLLSFLLVNPYSEPELFTSPPSPETLAFLQTLRPRGLYRSGRLKKDLEYLTGLHPTDFDVLLAQYPGDKVAEFCTHIRRRVGNKPHVLVAYAWCYYMAIFSGGRYLRAELFKAGGDFWEQTPGHDSTEAEKTTWSGGQGLSFWSFPGPHDGADIKEAFKTNLLAAESLFTPSERVDIIEEAKIIFRFSAELVHELDIKLATSFEAIHTVKAAQGPHKKEESLSAAIPDVSVPEAIVAWLHRPEVTTVMLALGCLTCVALWRFYY